MSSEKTEDPTPRRLRQARESGDVPVSAALTQTAAMLCAVVVLPAAGALTVRSFWDQLHAAVRGDVPSVEQLCSQLLVVTVPLLATAAAGALAIGFVQTGGVLSGKRLAPKLDSLNPVEGFKKLLSLDRLWSVTRAALTASLLGYLCADFLLDHASSLVASVGEVGPSSSLAWSLSKRLLWTALGLGGAMAIIDVLVTRRSWLRRNRMSKDEVKREYREAEGDPQLKQERKRAHQEMLENASVLAVRDASVLIVNPTHIATALRYDGDQDEAPRIIAQGEGAFARRLMDAARAYGVPIVRDIPVARALFELQTGDEIPEELYEAVAEILRGLWEESGNAPPDD